MKPFVTPDSGHLEIYQPLYLPITKSLHFKPSILAFFVASPQKNIDGKNVDSQVELASSFLSKFRINKPHSRLMHTNLVYFTNYDQTFLSCSR